MKIITFRKEFKELILSGKKTETRRINKYVKVGDVLLAKEGRLGKAFAELEVIGFRRERLQKITAEDALNEGLPIRWWLPFGDDPIICFKGIWNSINKKKGIRFEDNLIVSVIKFKLIKKR